MAADVREHAVAKADRVERLARQLRAELADHEHVDRVLQVGERFARGGRGGRRTLGGDESLVELHLAHLLFSLRNDRDELRFGCSARAATGSAAGLVAGDEQPCEVVEGGRRERLRPREDDRDTLVDRARDLAVGGDVDVGLAPEDGDDVVLADADARVRAVEDELDLPRRSP